MLARYVTDDVERQWASHKPEGKETIGWEEYRWGGTNILVTTILITTVLITIAITICIITITITTMGLEMHDTPPTWGVTITHRHHHEHHHQLGGAL